MTRIVAWRRRSAQAGNRGVGLDGWFVAMGIEALGLPWVRFDRLVDRSLSGQAQGWLDGHLHVLRYVLLALPTFAASPIGSTHSDGSQVTPPANGGGHVWRVRHAAALTVFGGALEC